jgi:FG-GAP-like repeat
MRTFRGFLFLFGWALASTVALAQSNPVPFVDQPLVPMSAAPGASGFSLTVNGAGFISGSVVNWNGTALPTTFVSKAQVTATVAASDIASPQTASVTVSNPAPGGGSSNVAFFQVATPESTVVLSAPSNTGGAGFVVVTADFNGDGKLDLAVTGTPHAQNTPFVYILLGNGDGTFQSAVAYPISFSPIFPAPIVTGDFNGDGKLDLVAGQSVLLGNGDGTFQPAISLPSQYVPSSGDQFVAGDFNGDGKLDVVAEEFGEGDLLVMLGNGDGTFTALTPISVTPDCGMPSADCLTNGSFRAADFNGDGVLDLLIDYNAEPFGNGTFAVYLGNGDGTFQTPVLTNASSSEGDVELLPIAVADFNGDGKQDVASAIEIYNPAKMGEPGYILALVGAVSLGGGNGTFNFNTNGFNLATALLQPAFTGDFNADGMLDVAMGITIALGNGAGLFQPPPIALSNVGGIAAVGDFNGDGRLDFAVFNGTSANVGTNVLVALQAVAPVVESSPASLDFATALLVGTTSSPQLMTLTNAGNATLKITGITISGTNASDFAQTNTCGSTLVINASCQVHVTFTPTGGGIRTANVAITDNGLGSPQTVALTGTSQDFSLAVSSNQTVTVTPGQAAADYALTVAPLYGFSQTVQLGCSGGPPQSTCTVSPNSVKLTGTGTATAKVVVVTTLGSASLAHPASFPPAGSRLALWLALPGLSGLVLLGSQGGGRARQRHLQWLHGLAFCCLLFLAVSWTGCGSSGNSGTPPGTYSLTVTGTFTSGSNVLKHAVSLTLIVQ